MYNKGNMTKILLVEDDKSLREIYGVRLLAEGYDIVSAGDGEEALAMAIKERPQLIVSDVMMPKISGFDMLDILRSTTETKDIKVIMMTALSSEDQRARGEALGADRYLVKSQVGIEDVVRTVHDVLGDALSPGSATQAFGSTTPSAAPRPTGVPPRPAPAPAQPAAAPVPPAPQPVSTPAAPAAPWNSPTQPTPVQPADNTSAPMPRPTAPFSTARPANLGERVIHPISQPTAPGPDISSRIQQELNAAAAPPPPAATYTPPAPIQTPPLPPAPVAPSAPQPTPPPVGAVPSLPQATSDPDLSFEESPRPASPQTPDGQPPATQ
jgi:CheY-like chemotaxis protein